MSNFLFEILKDLVTAWREGNRRVRIVIAVGIILVVASFLCAVTGDLNPRFRYVWQSLSLAFSVVAGLLLFIVVLFQQSKEEAKREQKIEAVEKRVLDNPKETQAAWELARVKLESYLNRNLAQVRSIYWLTVFVMLVGFAFIGLGVFLVYLSPDSFKPGLLAAICGIIVNFIGATFLVLYKATMAQATDYVAILERINAVGMSVQILETIDEQDSKLKNQTTADLAKQLLALYSVQRSVNSGGSKLRSE
jgi:ABC-type multidrug transport system fused ATPase/permease subunit